jgi:hypothetical protein
VILNLISLSSVKTQLGIATGTTTYDASISALIPVVSSDIRRMLNCSFDEYVTAAISSGSTQLLVSATNSYDITGLVQPRFNLGQVVYNPYIPVDTYLSSYDPKTGYYTMSAVATGSSDYIIPSVELAQFPAISKMIWYRLSKQNTTTSISKGIQSETYGPVSITYSAKEINRQWDYPQVIIDDLGIPFCRVG